MKRAPCPVLLLVLAGLFLALTVWSIRRSAVAGIEIIDRPHSVHPAAGGDGGSAR